MVFWSIGKFPVDMKKCYGLQILFLFSSCFFFWASPVINVSSQSLPSLEVDLDRDGPFYSGETVIAEVAIVPASEEIYAADIYLQLTEAGVLGTDKVRVDGVRSAEPELILGPYNELGGFDEARVVDEANQVGQIRVHVIGAQVIDGELVANPIRTPTVIFTISLVVTDSSEWEQEVETFDIVEIGLEFNETNSRLLDAALLELPFTTKDDVLQVYPPVSLILTPAPTSALTPIPGSPTPALSPPVLQEGADCGAQVYPDCSEGCVRVAILRRCLDLNLFLQNSISWVTLLAGIFTMLRLAIGFLGVATAGGDVGKLEEARNTIGFSMIGLAIVAAAWLILKTMSTVIPSAWEVWFGM